MSLRRSLALASVLFTSSTFAADWPFFRGPDHTGVSSETTFPTTWSPEQNVRWKVALPGPGNSSPVVAGGRVFLTCAEEKGRKRSLFCFSKSDGKQLWVKTVTYEKTDPTHATNPYGAASPAADVKNNLVLAFHGSAGLHAYDFDGNPLWSQDLGSARHIWGYASSPIVRGDSIYLNFGPGEQSALLCLDRKTGETRWRVPVTGSSSLDAQGRDAKGWIGSWGTPVLRTIGGREQLVVALPKEVAGFDPATGKKLWWCTGLSDLIYTDVLLSPDAQPDGSVVGVAMAGFAGPAVGFRVAPDASGDITATARLWRVEKNPQRIGTGVFLNGHVFMSSENALQCLDPLTGKELWRARPDGSTFWSPASATRGQIYFTSQKGTTYVVAPDPAKFTLVSKNPMNEPTNSAPALSDGHVFLRTAEHLYCIGQ